MDILYLPQVAEGDFPALQALIKGNRTYADWLQLAGGWRQYWGDQGCTIQAVTVKPGEFRKYLDARGFPYDLTQLLGFAEWVGKRQKA
jgi:hypothetical protein